MATISLVMVVVFVGICLNERQQNFQEVQSSLGGAIYKAAETDRKAKAQAESGPQDGAEESQAAQQGLIDASSSDPLNRENPQAASEEAGGMVLGRGEESPAIPVAVYRLSQDGSLTAAFPEQSIISVDESTIESAAQTIAQAADGTDVLSDYGLVYMKRSMKDGTYVTFADASHELKTPLTVILTNSSILEKHPETPLRENMQWLESTREEAVRMQELVSDMLSLAQAESTET